MDSSFVEDIEEYSDNDEEKEVDDDISAFRFPDNIEFIDDPHEIEEYDEDQLDEPTGLQRMKTI